MTRQRVMRAQPEYLEAAMILEVAVLDVIPGQEAAFQAAFAVAETILSSMRGYHSHQLQQCLEKDNRYLLLVEWEKLEHHTEGFRQSPRYEEWSALLHHYYDPFPEVQHYRKIVQPHSP